MYSLTKIQLSAETAQAIVRQHFGSQCNLLTFQELKEGYFNAAALLELDDGLKCVLKAAPAAHVRVLRYEHDIMRAEVESMRLVRQRTEVPVPEILVYDNSHSLLESDFFIMEFLNGTPFNNLRKEMSQEAQTAIETQMGQITRQMSEITGDAFGYWAQPEAPGTSWRACFGKMVHGVLQDGLDIGVELPLHYDEIYHRLEAHFDVLEEITTPRLVHWDLWDGNIFVNPESTKIVGVIDFERILWGDPLIESIFGNLNPDSPAARGFGGDVLNSPEQKVRRMLYNTYLWLIMIIETYYRRFETKDQENWARGRLDQELQNLANA